MSKELEILIQAKLDEAISEKNIKEQLKNIESKLEVGISTDPKVLNKMQQEINRLQKEIQSQAKGVTIIDGAKTSDEINKVTEGISKLYTSVDQAKSHLSNLGKTVDIKTDIDTETGKVISFNAEIQRAEGLVTRLKYQLNNSGQFEIISHQEIDKQMKATEKQVQRIFQTNKKLTEQRINEAKLAAKQDEELANKMADGREKIELARREAEKRQAQAQAEAINKNQELIRQEKEKLELFKQQYETDAKKLMQTHSKTANIEGIEESVKHVRSLEYGMIDVDREIKNANLQMRQFKAEASEAARSSMTIGEAFRTAMVKFPIWMAASTAFFGTVRSIRDAITQIIEIDSQLTVLQRVSNGQIQVNETLQESIRLAERLGNVISEVNEGFINYARQGFRGDELVMMTEYATLMSNISDLSVEDSASALTAAIKGFNLEAERGLHVVNSLNEVDKILSLISVMI